MSKFIQSGHYYDGNGVEQPPGDPGVVVCRRLHDFGPSHPLPDTGAITWCFLCYLPVVFNPAGPHLDVPRVCLQCAGIEPL